MRKSPFALLALAVLTLPGLLAEESKPPKGPAPELLEARRVGWLTAEPIIKNLESDSKDYPGIRAWLVEFRQASKGIDAKTPVANWPALDVDKLVTHNPVFWQAYYEIAPGDTGVFMLHSALMVVAGETTRAQYVGALALQRPGVSKEALKLLKLLLGAAAQAEGPSRQRVAAGVKLHDQEDYAGALRCFDEALVLWPQNGHAFHERGHTLTVQALLARGEKVRPNTLVLTSKFQPPPECDAAFARARKHDPFEIMSYQGDTSIFVDALQALAGKGLPVWNRINANPLEMVEFEDLRQLAEACQAAKIDDLALALRQILVIRRGRYKPEDYPFICTSLRRLAPSPITEATLKRVNEGGFLKLKQLVKANSDDNEQDARRAATKDVFRVDMLALCQKPMITFARLADGSGPYAEYVKTLEKKAGEFWKKQPKGKPQTLIIMIGIKPDKKSRIWCTTSGELPDGKLVELEQLLAKVTPPAVKDGPVVSALNCALWGADKLEGEPPPKLAFPKEWFDLAKKKGMGELEIPLSDELLKVVWPD